MEEIPLIKFADFMPIDEPGKTKIKFNISEGKGGESAWDLLVGPDTERWLEMTRYREKGNANNDLDAAEYVLSFAQYPRYGLNYFIFGGFFRVQKIVPEVTGGSGYELTPMDLYSEYIKRLIIKLDKPLGQSYLRWYDKVIERGPEVHELAPNTKLGNFPGYQDVRLRHHELQRLINNDEPSWRDALSSLKGVYVITDLSDGRLYVGSASGDANGLWQRWAAYGNRNNLTGGNKEFTHMKLDLDIGSSHLVENFQYSILEIFDPKTSADTILAREAFWKLALDTKKHGMNLN